MKTGETIQPQLKNTELYTVTYDYHKFVLNSLLPFLTDEGQTKKVLKRNQKLIDDGKIDELEKIETRRLVETFNLSIFDRVEPFFANWSRLVVDDIGKLACPREMVLPNIFVQLEHLRQRAEEFDLQPIDTVIPIPEHKKPTTLTRALSIEEANRDTLRLIYQRTTSTNEIS